MFSGDKVLDFEDDYTTDGYLCFEQVQPLPCTILALMPQTLLPSLKSLTLKAAQRTTP
jgi:hypothetical protein